MRNFKIYICMLLSIVIGGCSNNQDVEPTAKSIRSIDDFAWLGTLHNSFLDSVSRDGHEEGTRTGHTQIDWEQVHIQQVAQAQSLNIEPVYKDILVNSICDTKEFYDTDKLYVSAFPNGNLSEISAQFGRLFHLQVIDNFELSILNELVTDTKKNMDGVITNAQLTETVDRLCLLWNNKYGLSIKKDGLYSGYILSIAKASMEWWNDEDIPTRAATEVIGADVAGAIVGAASSAIIQYSTTGKVDAKAVGYSALGGAITGSTGIVGKVGKLITKFIFG